MLYGLFAATLPILIHLLNRRRSISVSFSNVALLQALQQDRMRRVRLKQWVLLALRTLLVALLVLAFARPAVRESNFGGGQSESTAVLMLDTSLSMKYEVDGGSLLEHAKRRAARALAQLDERDVVSLVSFDERASVSRGLTPDRIRLLLSGIVATSRASSPVAAVDATRSLVRGSNTQNREVFVFSDLARVGWDQVREPYDGFEGAVVYVVRPPEFVPANVGVRSVQPMGLFMTAGEPMKFAVEVENFGPQPVSELPVYAYVDGQRIGQKVIGIEASERKRVQFRYTPEKGGYRAFRVEIPDDALRCDNSRSSVFHIPDKLSIGLIGVPESRYYVKQALASGRGTALEVTTFEPGSVGSDAYQTFDVLILCNVARLGRAEINAIRKSVSHGAGLLMLIGEGIDLRDYNERILPVLCPLSLTGVSGRRDQRERFASFDPVASDHPTLLGLVGEDKQSPRFFLNYNSQLLRGTRALLNFGDNSAALVEYELGEGRTMALLSDADLTWSDLAVSGFFAPFLHRTIRYVSTGSFGTNDVVVGRRVARPVRDPNARDAVVQPPDGPVQTVWAQQRGDRSYWMIEEVEVAGVWDLYSRERVVDRFAAQIRSEEGDLASVEDESIVRLFPGADVVFVAPNQDLAAIVAQHRCGLELWRYFLFASLICVATELILMAGETRERG
jgi:hypothetical protein